MQHGIAYITNETGRKKAQSSTPSWVSSVLCIVWERYIITRHALTRCTIMACGRRAAVSDPKFMDFVDYCIVPFLCGGKGSLGLGVNESQLYVPFHLADISRAARYLPSAGSSARETTLHKLFHLVYSPIHSRLYVGRTCCFNALQLKTFGIPSPIHIYILYIYIYIWVEAYIRYAF